MRSQSPELLPGLQDLAGVSTSIGTMPADASGYYLVLRGLAVRLYSLNRVIYWALQRDGTFNAPRLLKRCRGLRNGSWSSES